MKVEIRSASKQDAEEIIARLKSEVTDGGGFWHNRELIRQGVEEDGLSVLISDGQIAGFLLHNDSSMNVMEIWLEFRRQGLGRRLAEFGMNRIYSAGQLGISIECTPSTSIPFWKSMGFIPQNNAPLCNLFWHIPQKRFELPPGSARKHVCVEFSSCRSTSESCVFHRNAALVDGALQLDERIAKHAHYDVYVRVSVEDAEIYHDKAKRDGAASLGIGFRNRFIRIDRLNAAAA